jgi:hypothetical protein
VNITDFFHNLGSNSTVGKSLQNILAKEYWVFFFREQVVFIGSMSLA